MQCRETGAEGLQKVPATTLVGRAQDTRDRRTRTRSSPGPSGVGDTKELCTEHRQRLCQEGERQPPQKPGTGSGTLPEVWGPGPVYLTGSAAVIKVVAWNNSGVVDP